MEHRYDQEFIPYILKCGRTTNFAAFLLSFVPVGINFFVFNLIPDMGMMTAAAASILSVMLPLLVVESISYFPLLGIPGFFMAFLTGNIGNLKVPVSTVVQDAAEVEIGSQKGNIISVVGVAMTNIVCITFVTFAVTIGSNLMLVLPDSILHALTYLLPAMMGSLFCKFAAASPKLGGVGLAISVVFFWIIGQGWLSFLPSPGGSPTYIIIMCSVFGTIFAAKKMTKNEEKRKEEER